MGQNPPVADAELHEDGAALREAREALMTEDIIASHVQTRTQDGIGGAVNATDGDWNRVAEDAAGAPNCPGWLPLAAPTDQMLPPPREDDQMISFENAITRDLVLPAMPAAAAAGSGVDRELNTPPSDMTFSLQCPAHDATLDICLILTANLAAMSSHGTRLVAYSNSLMGFGEYGLGLAFRGDLLSMLLAFIALRCMAIWAPVSLGSIAQFFVPSVRVTAMPGAGRPSFEYACLRAMLPAAVGILALTLATDGVRGLGTVFKWLVGGEISQSLGWSASVMIVFLVVPASVWATLRSYWALVAAHAAISQLIWPGFGHTSWTDVRVCAPRLEGSTAKANASAKEALDEL